MRVSVTLLWFRPAPTEQEHIAGILSHYEAKCTTDRIHRDKLLSLIAGLMQDLLTGKVRVKVDDPEEAATHA